jgi:hypothetical protein
MRFVARPQRIATPWSHSLALRPQVVAAISRLQPTATNTMTTVRNRAKAVTAVTAFVPAKLPVAMTRPTPTLRTDVAV